MKQLKIVSAKEIENKNELERLLKICIEDVKVELQKQKSQKQPIYAVKKGVKKSVERQKVLEVLQS